MSIESKGATTMKKELIEKAKLLYSYAYPIVWTNLMLSAPKEAFLHTTHIRELAKADGKSYKPNNDTLYSSISLQLKNSPYVLEIPEIDDRYLLVDILNLKTEVFFATGSKHENNGAGKYILLYRDQPIPEGYENYTVVRSDDNKNLLLIRTETFHEADYAKANQIQDQFVIKPVYPENVKDTGTPIKVPYVTYLENLSVKDFIKNFISTLEDTKIDEEIITILKDFGIDSEHFDYETLEDEKKTALENGFQEAYEDIKGYSGPEGYTSNGWTTYVKDVGSFGKKYLFRAFVSWFAWAANLPEDSIYPVAYTDTAGERLKSNNDYIIHFEKDNLPNAKHFWSVTVYGEPSGTLVANEYDKYVINSHGLEHLHFNNDGSLDILLSRTKPAKEEDFNNWLPLPEKEDAFSLLMRIYGADEETLEGRWQFPTIQQLS